jgi:hypothetical protein
VFESVAPAIFGSPIYRVRGAHWRFFPVAAHNARLPQQIRHWSLADYEDWSARVQGQEESGAARFFHMVKRRPLGSRALA